jgi:hypothetical protein
VIAFAYCKHSSITINVASTWSISIYISLCSSMSNVTLHKEVVFVSIVASWNSLLNTFIILVVSHLFTMVSSMPCTCFHVQCNHSKMWGFRLLNLKSTYGFWLPLIYCLRITIVQELNCTLNACFSDHCIMTYVG